MNDNIKHVIIPGPLVLMRHKLTFQRFEWAMHSHGKVKASERQMSNFYSLWPAAI